MASAVDICNIALGRLNIDPINDISPPVTAVEKACARLYPTARDDTLRSFPWNFAQKEVQLSLVAGVTKVGYEYVYAMPTDCVAARNIVSAAGRNIEQKYQVISNDAGTAKIILSNVAEMWLAYTSNDIATPLFDASFIDALSWRLAADLSVPLKFSAEIQTAMWQAHTSILAHAQANDAAEGKQEPFNSNPWTEARG